MRRGEVYFTNRDGFSVGSEMQGNRPALIVSNDKSNTFSGAVEVVYLTTQEKKDLPTHVRVRSGSAISTVLCEQIDTISKERLGGFLCELTPAEMAMVDVALAISIGIDTPPASTKPAREERTDNRVEAERDLYKRLYEDLLERVLER